MDWAWYWLFFRAFAVVRLFLASCFCLDWGGVCVVFFIPAQLLPGILRRFQAFELVGFATAFRYPGVEPCSC